MPDVDRSDEGEREILSRKEACDLAENFDGKDPFPYIPRALLSAGHIIEYAKKTGMISPLFEGIKRMKQASYQGRIGKNAYKFDHSKEFVPVPIENNRLVVEANSIVFVECDIDFRLPDFIAVRFNLHIRHIHRGLLLGTGPLVDPGYWGKLCIPLHNLTDKNYPIPVDEGLIWVEFTKTSQGFPAEFVEFSTERLRSSRNWSIHEFISAAAAQYGNTPVSIRSSISGVVKRAEDVEKSAKRVMKIGYAGGFTAFFTLVIALITAIWTNYANIQSAYNLVDSKVELNEDSIDILQDSIGKIQNENNIERLQISIEILQIQIKDMEKDIRKLRDQLTDTERQDSSEGG